MTEESNKRADENIDALSSMLSEYTRKSGDEQLQTNEDQISASPDGTDSVQMFEDLTAAKRSVENSPFYFLMNYARKPDSKPVIPDDVEQL